jgi:molybdopterin-guanine dinucleotide biosynthesis protein A
MKTHNICGIILAGGKSSRMGTNKAHLQFQHHDFLAHSYQLLRASHIETVVVSGNYTNYPCVPDLKPFHGPAAAILSVWNILQNSAFDKLVICAVDMPFITPPLIEQLINNCHNCEATYFEDNYLPCCINTSALKKITHINFDHQPLHVLLNQFIVNNLEIPIQHRSSFCNINTPTDFEQLLYKP